MCGIFGLAVKGNTDYDLSFLTKSLNSLAKFSETRGVDSSGICIQNHDDNAFHVIKGPLKVSSLLKRVQAKKDLNNLFCKKNHNSNKLAFGHARLVTNGSQLNDNNNQPVYKDGIICIHNGIVVNSDKLWEKYTSISRKYDIDTEIIPSLLRLNLNSNISLELAVEKTINNIKGTVSIACVLNDLNKFVLATNNGSLYILHNNDIMFFASERVILKKLIDKFSLHKLINNLNLFQLESNNLMILDLDNFIFHKNSFDNIKLNKSCEKFINKKEVKLFKEKSEKIQLSTVIDLNKIHENSNAEKDQEILVYPINKIKKLKRCTKCILPHTFPFISFDTNGVCNYCHNYKKKNHPRSLDELKKLVEPYRSKDGSPDCLVPFSGGRDSVYTLHIIKNILKLNPITFTYDWGMVTDLARRNIARICGKLGVENIIIAADLHWKRKNIKKNITAWLKNPELGMIPLFMAGDKFFFYYAEKVKKENNIKLNIWGINHLENTDFKTGFGGLKPNFNKKTIYSLSLFNKLQLFSYVAKNMIKSPGYLNQSIFDSLGSFASRYISPKRDYYHLFDYIMWNEKELDETIKNEYDWETCVDTKSTWRIGDGTASFYNYIYTLVAGFSENDTFRSNQIREGSISREEALDLVMEENKPRYNSLKWYLDILDLDFQNTIKAINKINRLY